MKKLLPLLISFLFFSAKANEIYVDNPYSASFKKAYALYPSVPKGILEAVAFTQSRFYHLTDDAEPSCIGMPRALGVMGLIEDGKGYFRNNLLYVSQLSGLRASEIKKDPETNIIAYASAFHALQKQTNNFSDSPADYKSILVSLSELPLQNDVVNDFVMNSHLYQIYWFLNKGEFQDAYNFPDHNLDLKTIFGSNYDILSASSLRVSQTAVQNEAGQSYKNSGAANIMSPDYAPALYTPAATCNYSSRNGVVISAVTIHDIEGTYSGCISWFQNCAASVSAHYVLRSSDGQITQMVLESAKAWHVGTENPYTVGLEHEGYVSSASWYTNAMYNASAALVKDICTDNNINPLRCYFGPGCSGGYTNCLEGSCVKIKGHQMFPNQTHSDPGPYWNWDKYYKLINNTYTVTTYTATSGNFYDSGGSAGNYTNDERKVWRFTASGATNITLNFTAFNVENNYDYLFIYDGGSLNSPLIGKYSGTVNPGPVTSTNDTLMVEFRSDCATIASGWAATYTTNTSSTSTVDAVAPTTSVTTLNAWKTASFTTTFNDADNAGGSGVEKGYYQVIDFNGTEWRANYTHGFFADNFDNAIHPEWTQKVGTWTISGNALVQTDETSPAANNTNIYAALTQTLSNRYLYHFLAKFEGAGTNRRAGFHFFCDQPDSSNRNNSYFVWFRLDDQAIQLYKVVNNNFGSPVVNLPLTFSAGQWYDIKVIYDRITGKISVYMNNSQIATWTDSSPYSSGGYISFRSGNSKFSIDEIKIYRSRAASANVTVGSGNAFDIRYQNPSPVQNSAKVKSICQDSAGNLSPIFYHDLNVDWTPPSNIPQINDGTASDLTITCTKDSLSANWLPSGDANSGIVKYWYSIGTAPGSTNVVTWTSNWAATAITTKSLSLTHNTVYYYNVKAENGAGLFSSVISTDGQKADTACIMTAIQELSGDNKFFVFPNPFTQQINFASDFENETDLSIVITDATGKIISSLKAGKVKGEYRKEIPVGYLASGIYFIRIQAGSETYSKKLVKE